MNDTTPIVKCPTCGKSVAWLEENVQRPFCSERCRLIDFGAWASEEHVIAGEEAYDDFSDDEAQ